MFSPRELPAAAGSIEPITGRYVHVDVSGIRYRVYFKEGSNPEGIPLICQHTAGDGRQWRWLMSDPVVVARFRVIANHLPYHGRSPIPKRV